MPSAYLPELCRNVKRLTVLTPADVRLMLARTEGCVAGVAEELVREWPALLEPGLQSLADRVTLRACRARVVGSQVPVQ